MKWMLLLVLVVIGIGTLMGTTAGYAGDVRLEVPSVAMPGIVIA